MSQDSGRSRTEDLRRRWLERFRATGTTPEQAAERVRIDSERLTAPDPTPTTPETPEAVRIDSEAIQQGSGQDSAPADAPASDVATSGQGPMTAEQADRMIALLERIELNTLTPAFTDFYLRTSWKSFDPKVFGKSVGVFQQLRDFCRQAFGVGNEA